jgi:uncharacterized protein (TIGR02145 family)
MKKLLYLFLTVLIVACSGDDGNNNQDDNDGDNNNTLNCDVNPVQWISYGDQDWTIENACNITYRDGTPIPEVTDVNEWNNLTTGAWCYYDNDPTNSRLYNWFAVVGIHDADPNTPNKEFAPEGWHVPSNGQWTILEEFLIGNGYNYDGLAIPCSPCSLDQNKIAKSMASTTGWNGSATTGDPGNDQSSNNSSGFNAYPVGFRGTSYEDGAFVYEGTNAVFWSSTENGIGTRTLSMTSKRPFRSLGGNVQNGFSVRFVRD